MTLNEKEILDYIDEINLLLEKAYVPYSKFPVAALLIDNNGKKHKGVNVENASFGLTLCAERNAITTAVTENMKKINDFNASAFTKENQKMVEKYVTKGKIGKLENVTGDIKKMMEENTKVNKRNQSFKDQLNQGRKKTRD